jgi:hypothetical protein
VLNLPTPEGLKEKLSIKQQEDEFILRECYEEWLERSLIPNLTAEGCEGSWQSPTLYKNWEKVNSWLGEKGWTIKTWTTREESWLMTAHDYHEYSMYNYLVMPIIYKQDREVSHPLEDWG